MVCNLLCVLMSKLQLFQEIATMLTHTVSKKMSLLAIACGALALSGCVSVPDAIKGSTATPVQQLTSVQNAQNLFVGAEARFGGTVVNVANEKRAGGDWESGLIAPEECFARRSNLVHALTMPWNAQLGREENFYPIPQRGGIYSPEVCTYLGRHLRHVFAS